MDGRLAKCGLGGRADHFLPMNLAGRRGGDSVGFVTGARRRSGNIVGVHVLDGISVLRDDLLQRVAGFIPAVLRTALKPCGDKPRRSFVVHCGRVTLER